MNSILCRFFGGSSKPAPVPYPQRHDMPKHDPIPVVIRCSD